MRLQGIQGCDECTLIPQEVLMAHHDICLEEGDHVILFITDSRHVEAVEKLFQAPPSFL
jgi:trk system potassium uptake protein TrkA